MGVAAVLRLFAGKTALRFGLIAAAVVGVAILQDFAGLLVHYVLRLRLAAGQNLPLGLLIAALVVYMPRLLRNLTTQHPIFMDGIAVIRMGMAAAAFPLAAEQVAANICIAGAGMLMP